MPDKIVGTRVRLAWPSLVAMAGFLLAPAVLQAQKTVKLEGKIGEGRALQNVALSGELGAFRHARLHFRVRLDDNRDISTVNRCVITGRKRDGGMDQGGFSCGTSADIDRKNLVVLGDITFEPSGVVRDLYVPATELGDDDWSPEGSGREEESSFKLHADSAGAHLVIRDKNGHSVFQLSADSLGAFFRVRDSAGREVLRFQVDSSRIAGRIRSH